jgi:hypothetical protein
METMKDKLLNRMFKKVENVVIDISTNSIGLKKDGSIFTVIKDDEGYTLNENIFDQMSVTFPAYAQAVPLEQVKHLDMVLDSKGEIFGWVVDKKPKTLEVMRTTGQITRVSPAKANLLGTGQTIMVITNTFSSMDSQSLQTMMLLSENGDSSNSMLPFLLSQQGNQQMNPMMLAALVSKGNSSIDPMMLAMMMQSNTNQQKTAYIPSTHLIKALVEAKNDGNEITITQAEYALEAERIASMNTQVPQMNPMMLALLLGK